MHLKSMHAIFVVVEFAKIENRRKPVFLAYCNEKGDGGVNTIDLLNDNAELERFCDWLINEEDLCVVLPKSNDLYPFINRAGRRKSKEASILAISEIQKIIPVELHDFSGKSKLGDIAIELGLTISKLPKPRAWSERPLSSENVTYIGNRISILKEVFTRIRQIQADLPDPTRIDTYEIECELERTVTHIENLEKKKAFLRNQLLDGLKFQNKDGQLFKRIEFTRAKRTLSITQLSRLVIESQSHLDAELPVSKMLLEEIQSILGENYSRLYIDEVTTTEVQLRKRNQNTR